MEMQQQSRPAIAYWSIDLRMSSALPEKNVHLSPKGDTVLARFFLMSVPILIEALFFTDLGDFDELVGAKMDAEVWKDESEFHGVLFRASCPVPPVDDLPCPFDRPYRSRRAYGFCLSASPKLLSMHKRVSSCGVSKSHEATSCLCLKRREGFDINGRASEDGSLLIWSLLQLPFW
jgi:hypothetical protein